MTHPQEGGSYRREADQSLTRVAFTAKAGSKPEGEPVAQSASVPQPDADAAMPPTTETASDTDGAGKKGKA